MLLLDLSMFRNRLLPYPQRDTVNKIREHLPFRNLLLLGMRTGTPPGYSRSALSSGSRRQCLNRRSRLRPGKISRRLPQDLVGLADFAHLPLQGLYPFPLTACLAQHGRPDHVPPAAPSLSASPPCKFQGRISSLCSSSWLHLLRIRSLCEIRCGSPLPSGRSPSTLSWPCS
jgi:hypothetical protein